MKLKSKLPAFGLCAALLLSALTGCGTSAPADSSGSGGSLSTPSAGQTVTLSSSDQAQPRQAATLELTEATAITLQGDSVQIDGEGAWADGGVVTITAGGVYVVSGTLNDGRILVNAPDADVTLALSGADITCSYGSPIYIYKAGSATVHVAAGTENTLTDGASYTFADTLSSAADEEPNACLYSKADLILEGAGALTVNGNYNNGVTGKDTLTIYDVTLTVHAANHGVNGKDSNTIDSAALTVVCGGDAIRSTNDTDDTLGWVSVSNSTLTLTAGEDGIQAQTWANLSSGSYTVTSGGGSAVTPGDDVSAKGIKAGTTLTLASGVYTLDCSDDAVHANGDVTVSGGVYAVSTGDDAFHSDGLLTVSGGTVEVLTCYEGLEGDSVDISGGVISLISTDDGVNAAGGVDGSGFAGPGMGGTFGQTGDSHSLTISGGTLTVAAGGDGLDANGSVTMMGGTVTVSSTGAADGALDYDGSFTLTGGTLFAASAGNMAQTPSVLEQYAISVSFGQTLSAGTQITFSSSQDFTFQLSAPAVHVVFSSPELAQGDTYTVSYDDTVLTELTLSDSLTSYGQTGMGGSKGA